MINNKRWLSEKDIFNINSVKRRIHTHIHSTPHTLELIRIIENAVRRELRNGIGNSYNNLNNNLKSIVEKDLNKTLKIQKNIKRIRELIELRNKKKNIYEKLQDDLSLIKKFKPNELKNYSNNNLLSLKIPNPIEYEFYNQYDSQDKNLLESVINSVLQRENINTVDDKLLGCTPRANGVITTGEYFNRNNINYIGRNCKYLMESLESAISWKNIDLSLHGVGSVEDISILMFLLATREDSFDVNNEYIRSNGIIKKCNIFYLFAPYIKNFNDRETKAIYIEPLSKQYKKICPNMFIEKDGKNIRKLNQNLTCKHIYNYLKKIHDNYHKTDNEKKFNWEKFGIFMYGLIKVTIASINKIFSESMDEVTSSTYSNIKDSYNKSIENLEKLLISNLSGYIRIKKDALSHKDGIYGFSENNNNSYSNPLIDSKKKSNFIRIIGGFNNIANTVNFTPNRFLFNFKNSCNKIIGPYGLIDKYCTSDCYDQNITFTKMSNFVYGSNIIDSNNNSNNRQNIKLENKIYMGGFNHTELIQKYSYHIFVEYYKVKYYIIYSEYKYLDYIVNKYKNLETIDESID